MKIVKLSEVPVVQSCYLALNNKIIKGTVTKQCAVQDFRYQRQPDNTWKNIPIIKQWTTVSYEREVNYGADRSYRYMGNNLFMNSCNREVLVDETPIADGCGEACQKTA